MSLWMYKYSQIWQIKWSFKFYSWADKIFFCYNKIYTTHHLSDMIINFFFFISMITYLIYSWNFVK